MSGVHKTGWLKKRTVKTVGGIGVWKKRWVVLKDGVMSYFADDKGSECKGTVSLSAVFRIAVSNMEQSSWSRWTSSVKDGCQFEMEQSGRIYIWAADTPKECHEWVEALYASCPNSQLKRDKSVHDLKLLAPPSSSQLPPGSHTTSLALPSSGASSSSSPRSVSEGGAGPIGGSSGATWDGQSIKGYLHKKNPGFQYKNFGTYKKRWVVLDRKAQTMTYWETESEASHDSTPKGSIDLRQMDWTKTYAACFPPLSASSGSVAASPSSSSASSSSSSSSTSLSSASSASASSPSPSTSSDSTTAASPSPSPADGASASAPAPAPSPVSPTSPTSPPPSGTADAHGDVFFGKGEVGRGFELYIKGEARVYEFLADSAGVRQQWLEALFHLPPGLNLHALTDPVRVNALSTCMDTYEVDMALLKRITGHDWQFECDYTALGSAASEIPDEKTRAAVPPIAWSHLHQIVLLLQSFCTRDPCLQSLLHGVPTRKIVTRVGWGAGGGRTHTPSTGSTGSTGSAGASAGGAAAAADPSPPSSSDPLILAAALSSSSASSASASASSFSPSSSLSSLSPSTGKRGIPPLVHQLLVEQGCLVAQRKAANFGVALEDLGSVQQEPLLAAQLPAPPSVALKHEGLASLNLRTILGFLDEEKQLQRQLDALKSLTGVEWVVTCAYAALCAHPGLDAEQRFALGHILWGERLEAITESLKALLAEGGDAEATRTQLTQAVHRRQIVLFREQHDVGKGFYQQLVVEDGILYAQTKMEYITTGLSEMASAECLALLRQALASDTLSTTAATIEATR